MSRTNTYLRELPPGLTHIDVYWVLRLFNVTDPCAQHAVKKLLADGSGDKDRATNIREAWETLDRWVEMESESTPEELRQQHPDGLTRWIEKTRQRSESIDPWLQPERQEQVRERHDFVPDDAWTIDSAFSAAREGHAGAIAWINQDDGMYWDEETQQIMATATRWEPHPPDRPLASNCPDGGACRHKCGLEPCKGQS